MDRKETVIDSDIPKVDYIKLLYIRGILNNRFDLALGNRFESCLVEMKKAYRSGVDISTISDFAKTSNSYNVFIMSL